MMERSYKLVGAFIGAALLAACSGNSLSSSVPSSATPPLAAPGADLPQSSRSLPMLGRYASHRIKKNVQTETVLYSFAGGTDGALPDAAPINVSGTLYGTTYNGGTNNDGTVYSVTPSGMETVLYSFAGGTDGAHPSSGLVNVGGTLYGTTDNGGGSGDGTVFKITTSGTETVLYSFAGGSDGIEPLTGPLLNVNGTLYGTTVNGGVAGCAGPGCGTVFKITTAGSYHQLYRFAGGSDAGNPYSGLIKVGSALYGMTWGGGVYNQGAVFKITTSGVETVLHSFGSGTDGAQPVSGLIKVGSALYGATASGGTSGYGVVFAITTSGAETVLYSFKGGADGTHPLSSLTNVGGTLFGTTGSGGTANAGTVFALLPNSGPEIVVYTFAGGTDGVEPGEGIGLTNVGGTLYGTTEGGGANGSGTVYSLSF